MELTKEQKGIINSSGNIKVNAVAGSGKTTTIIEYAKARPRSSKILYLAFNRSVKLDAERKFTQKGLDNVKVETAHSLAYGRIVFKNGYVVKSNGYNITEIAELLNLNGYGEKYAEYILANHINKFIALFCNSDKKQVQDLNYLETVTDGKAAAFVGRHYDYIERQARLLLSKMDKGSIDITHDFYLKKFQLSEPTLHYDYILFDEGQDASAAMLDIFLKQRATKLIVGDTHQQIYGWRHAVNSLEKVDYPTFHLSTSFRFKQQIADLAVEVLGFKKHINKDKKIVIIGKGSTEAIQTKAVLARTNLGLLLKAIEYVTEKKELKHIYFEGNIHSYTYADDGASLYDVLHLYNGKHHLIKDQLIKKMKSLAELEEYIRTAEEVQLGMMVEIVKAYGNEIPKIIKKIKEKHIGDNDKDKAEIIFSTVHRCKGMEYDTVQLVNDFITEEKLEELKKEKKEIQADKLNEEINLLYVAVTRAKKSLYIPEALMPKNFKRAADIHVLKEPPVEEGVQNQAESQPKQHAVAGLPKAYSHDMIREKHKDAYKPWTPELDAKLEQMFSEGVNLRDLAKHFGRTRGAIEARIKKLELREKLV
ncbi:MAG TPA: UvrD-helicase domain-containing protein [Flavipsychrobacter sp.]|nr:UvrD-helicase domain-containing protein [Flavipsychrobacter sp.]